MKLQLVSKDKTNTKCSFIIDGAEYWYVNSLRRIMINEVPVLAIEDVEFRKNDSALYDEIVALRLGLLPLTTDLKTLNLKEECTCKGAGCSLCQVVFKLKEKGPKMVYAKSLKANDAKTKVVYPDMPIVKLAKNQELEFVATAILGKGEEHVKWSPCLAYYKYYPSIKIDNKKCSKDCKKCIESCPFGILEMKQGKVVVNQKKLLECHLCNACVDACPNDAIQIQEDETKHVFYLESWGQLSCKDIIEEAIRIFDNKLLQLSKQLKK
ncbi:DNA-directed RNA polymerase subunit D [Candidatus Woesearchaeota archaeon]|nr:DNA-directed RNA polymerase subunit D [Candidatus Woesearchaeota archaeon]RLE43696.1 MAG: DNA-directed RNA polymerase subunit D [Candidatus Woesearchaeota archaeon]